MVTVYLDADCSINQALLQLRQQVKEQYQSCWYKKRFGYYEKPSCLKHKRSKMRRLTIQSQGKLRLKIDQQTRYRRDRPSNAAGR